MKKNDFIEIDYTAKIKNTGEVFDLTSEKKAKELNIYNSKYSYHPIIIILGQGFILKSLEDKVFKIDEKDIGKEFTFAFKPEEAFGPREPKLIRTFPSSFFKAKDMNPVVGQTIDLEDKNGKKMTGKIMSVSAGRVRVDFNHVLAGKEIEYDLTVNKLFKTRENKIDAVIEMFVQSKSKDVTKQIDGNVVTINLPSELDNAVMKQLIAKYSTEFIEKIDEVKFVETFKNVKDNK
ncbi:MAG: FKBP-type peptidyl-prolyl cis-trans isomerase [Candidatus Aenigmarchaeota archaeon]|nr:FKBP-type peptidyl-prolyl cis-trans isomerase [Candidatus Aenigmarchaeota archaeon]